MARLLKEADVKRLLTMADAVTAVEEAFRSVAQSRALNVPRQRGTLARRRDHQHACRCFPSDRYDRCQMLSDRAAGHHGRIQLYDARL